MGVSGQRNATAALPPGKTRYPLYRRLGWPQGRTGRVRKTSPPPGLDRRTVQPVASCRTDWAIQVYIYISIIHNQVLLRCDPHVTCNWTVITSVLFVINYPTYDGYSYSTLWRNCVKQTRNHCNRGTWGGPSKRAGNSLTRNSVEALVRLVSVQHQTKRRILRKYPTRPWKCVCCT